MIQLDSPPPNPTGPETPSFSAVNTRMCGRTPGATNLAAGRGVSSKSEYRFVRRDGTVTWVHGTAVQLRDANGRLSGYIGTVADFTERKEAELALRESEERFRMLADNIAQFAWVCDGGWGLKAQSCIGHRAKSTASDTPPRPLSP